MQGINLLGTGSTIGRQRYSPSAVSTSYAGVTPVTTHPKSGQRPHIAARLRAREAETSIRSSSATLDGRDLKLASSVRGESGKQTKQSAARGPTSRARFVF